MCARVDSPRGKQILGQAQPKTVASALAYAITCARTTLALLRPIFHYNSRALPKRDLLFRLRRDECPIRSDRHAMIMA